MCVYSVVGIFIINNNNFAKFRAMEGQEREVMWELITLLRERGPSSEYCAPGMCHSLCYCRQGVPRLIVYASWLQGAHSWVEKTNVTWCLVCYARGEHGRPRVPKGGTSTQTEVMPDLRLGG